MKVERNGAYFPFTTTPFPDALLDQVMPELRDTEWRLLCVIVRQTLGWMENGEPKTSDWLSHSQLKRRTGRASAAISSAIEFLCRNNLIDVTGRDGRSFNTPAERRRHHGNLYFSLNPEALTGEGLPVQFQTELRNPKTTINTETNAVVVDAENRNLPLVDESRSEHSREIQAEWQRVGEMLKSKGPEFIKPRTEAGPSNATYSRQIESLQDADKKPAVEVANPKIRRYSEGSDIPPNS